MKLFNRDERQVMPKGTKIFTGPAPTIPTRLLFALGGLLETLGCVSEAYFVQLQSEQPDATPEPAHLVLEIRMKAGTPMRFEDLAPKIGETIKGNYGVADKPIDIIEIKEGKAPFPGSQLFAKFNDKGGVPT